MQYNYLNFTKGQNLVTYPVCRPAPQHFPCNLRQSDARSAPARSAHERARGKDAATDNVAAAARKRKHLAYVAAARSLAWQRHASSPPTTSSILRSYKVKVGSKPERQSHRGVWSDGSKNNILRCKSEFQVRWRKPEPVRSVAK